MRGERTEGLAEHLVGHRLAGLEGMRAVHEHFGLDDRHDALLLAERGIARQGMRVGLDAEAGGIARADVDDRAPLGETGAETVVFLEPLAQAVETLGDGLVREIGEGLRALVDLDAREDAERCEVLRERHAGAGLLAQRLVVHDHAADGLVDAGGREQHLAVELAVRFGRFERDGIETLLDGAGAFVGSEDPLAGGDHTARDALKFRVVHLPSAPVRGVRRVVTLSAQYFSKCALPPGAHNARKSTATGCIRPQSVLKWSYIVRRGRPP